MKVQTKHQVSVAFIEKSGWGGVTIKCTPYDIVNTFSYRKLYHLHGHIQEQSLQYFYMTLKLQRVGYHGNRLDFVKLKGL